MSDTFFSTTLTAALCGPYYTTASTMNDDGQNILLYSEIGFWFDIPKQMLPPSKILLQNEFEVFNAIKNASVIPSFSSNRILERYGHTSGKIDIPILNNEAYTNYYSVCKKKIK